MSKILTITAKRLTMICLFNVIFLTGIGIQRVVAQKEPITLYAPGETIYEIDPQLVQEEKSLEVVENLFLGLTDVDPRTSLIRPEVAKKWTTNAAGDTWTFELRTDIPWVQWNPSTKTVTELRKVVASDFVYGIKRACDPRLNAAYTVVAARLIKGCDVVARKRPNQVKDVDFDQISVKALSDSKLEIQTQGVLSYFLSTSAMAMFRAVPPEMVRTYGEGWTAAGLIVSNGPYVMDENSPGIQRIFVKNPLYPSDVNENYGGNIERVVFSLGCNNCVGFNNYKLDQIDTIEANSDTIDLVRTDPELAKQFVQRKKMSVEYFVFNYEKPPFNNVHVRRAFSAAADRRSYTDGFFKSTSLPIDHIIPPGAFGAVPLEMAFIGSADLPGYDIAFAKLELAAAGFPNCKGFPTINIAVIETFQAEYLKASLVTNLGCNPDALNILRLDYGTLLQATGDTAPKEQRPNLFSNIWGADYPDAQSFMFDVLSCKAMNASRRPCGPLDQKIEAASRELRADKRIELYAALEQAMFGKKGEFPIAPVRIPTSPFLVKPWYHGFFETDGLFAGKHWNSQRIDQKLQLAARSAKH